MAHGQNHKPLWVETVDNAEFAEQNLAELVAVDLGHLPAAPGVMPYRRGLGEEVPHPAPGGQRAVLGDRVDDL
jgi:hypothetical protein